jgi:tetratricopeptide (TPR) repeat protein
MTRRGRISARLLAPGLAAALAAALAAGPAGAGPTPVAPAERPSGAPSVAPSPEAAIRVRGGTHPDRGRLVFDWTRPVDYTVETGERTVRIVFSRPGTADLSRVRRSPPRNVASVEQDADADRMAVTVGIPEGSTVRHFRSGSSVAVDILDPPRGRAATPAATPAAAPAAAPEAPAPRAAPAVPVATTGPLPSPAAAGPATVSVDPGRAASAAVFVRGGFLYMVFDGPFPAGVVPSVQAAGRRVGAPEILPIPGIAGFRIAIPDGLEPDVRTEGTVWRVVLRPPAGAPAAPSLPVVAQPDFLLGARVLVRAPSATMVVALEDPSAGDRLLVVPLGEPGAVSVPHAFLQARLLPAAQGIVVRPVADGVAVRPVRDGVEVVAEGGLLLSPPEDRLLAGARESGAADGKGAAPLFEFAAWRRGGADTFSETRQALQQAIADAEEPARDRGRLDLARFYLGHGFGAEAAGLFSFVAARQPELEGQPEFRALRGAARVLAGDCAGAGEDLSAAGLDAHPEALLWRAAAAACAGRWDEAAAGFGRVGDVLDRYPDPFFRRLSQLAVEAAVETGNAEEALGLIGGIAVRVPGWEETPAGAYLRGRAERIAGRADRAVELWRSVAASADQLYRTRAEFALVDQELEDGTIAPDQAIERLERLRFAWRGDDLELSILRRLGELYLAAGRHALGLDTLRTALLLFPDHADAPAVESRLRQGFSDLFTGAAAAALSPLDALALHGQYRDLHPPGPEGDGIIRHLADRLVEIDLLDRAAEMLEPLVEKRLAGAEKAEVGARLASIRLLDGEPALAIAALDASEVAEVPAGLASERRVLRARALAETGRSADALALLAGEPGRPADLLRVDIAWRAGNWAEAASALARIVGAPPPAGTALSAREAQMVLNRAVALGLAGDAEGLERLAAEFGPAMAATPDADAFRVLTRAGQGGGSIDLATIQRRVAEVDVFRSFLAEYRGDRAPGPPPGG